MRRGAGGWLVAGCIVLMSQGALGANLSASLRNFYAEYEIVLQCQEQAELGAADAALAKAAIAKIEMHYLQRDSSIDKDRLLKEAVAHKDEGFRIATRSGRSDLRPYCRMSLNELLAKAEEIDPSGKGQ
ncbi:MAG: hypothetical protein ACREDO_09185 [Methyloceanibacter sp.]